MNSMDGLNVEQIKRASEILGNIAVAWFSVGVISPFFMSLGERLAFIRPSMVSLFMAGFFFRWSLDLLKEVES